MSDSRQCASGSLLVMSGSLLVMSGSLLCASGSYTRANGSLPGEERLDGGFFTARACRVGPGFRLRLHPGYARSMLEEEEEEEEARKGAREGEEPAGVLPAPIVRCYRVPGAAAAAGFMAGAPRPGAGDRMPST